VIEIEVEVGLLFGQGYSPDASPELSPLPSDTAPAIVPVTEARTPIPDHNSAPLPKQPPSLSTAASIKYSARPVALKGTNAMLVYACIASSSGVVYH
jgi:hypothetical protein